MFEELYTMEKIIKKGNAGLNGIYLQPNILTTVFMSMLYKYTFCFTYLENETLKDLNMKLQDEKQDEMQSKF